MDIHILWVFLVLVAMATCSVDENNCPLMSLTYKMSFFNNKCYQFYYGTKTWKAARDYCLTNFGRLAKVNDPETQTFLKNNLNSMAWNANEMWIGMHDMDEELVWKWTAKPGGTEEPVTWTNWHEEHPEGWLHDYRDCVVMKKDGGAWTWHEAACNMYPWSYKFICEYDPIYEDENVQNSAGGIFQSPTTRVTTKPPPTSPDLSTNNNNMMTSIRHNVPLTGENQHLGDYPYRGNATGAETYLRGDLAGLNGHIPKVAESLEKEQKSDRVPLYAVIVSFGAGVLFAVIIILFVLLRRRRRKHKESENFPTVIYHSQPTAELGAVGYAGGAAGGVPLVCASGGRSCKLAVDMGKEKCVCGEEHEDLSKANRRSTNIYVPVGGVAADEDIAVTVAPDPDSCEPSTSAFSSARDLSLFNEEPPTYDEAIAGIERANSQTEDRCENIYSSEPHHLNHNDAPQQPPPPPKMTERPCGQGAIPKTTTAMPKAPVPTETYLPMNGSPKLPSHSRQDSNVNQYTPMSLGELPPIPTDQGYEIPVCTKLDPETVKSLRSPMEEQNDPASIYAEIPDRNSRLYRNEEQIYSTID